MKSSIQKTLVIIKPDGVQRTLMGEIIKRFEHVGLKFVAMKMLFADRDTIGEHYSFDDEWKRGVGERILKDKKVEDFETKEAIALGDELVQQLKDFMTSGPIVVMALEGSHAIALTRKIVGGTEPLTSDVGTIRGDFVLDSYELADIEKRAIKNIIHASANTEDAERELKIWFSEKELMKYKTVHESIMYDTDF